MKIDTKIFRDALLRVEYSFVIEAKVSHDKIQFIREINWEAYRLRDDPALYKFYCDILDMETSNPLLTSVQKEVIKVIRETYEYMLNETSTHEIL